MVEREMTQTLTHRSTARPRSSQQHALACEPTFPARHAHITLTQRARSLRLAPPHDTHVAPLALPSLDAPPTPLGPPTYPSGAGLGRLITLLASEPEPDKLPAYLMRELAQQLGADGAYLFRSDAASKTLALTPLAIGPGAWASSMVSNLGPIASSWRFRLASARRTCRRASGSPNNP